MQSSNKDSILLSNILKEVFKREGIEFTTSTFLRWRVIDDRTIPRVIKSLTDLLTEFTDGSYQLTLSEVKISHIEKEPFTISEITIEVACENGQWSEPRIYTDTEEFGPEHDTPQALYARLQKIKETFKVVLPYITLVIEIAKLIRGFIH